MPRCRLNQFTCQSDPGSCIDMSLVCDGVMDCVDQSDERNCGPLTTNTRNRTKKDDMAANKLAKLIGLLNQRKTITHIQDQLQTKMPSIKILFAKFNSTIT